MRVEVSSEKVSGDFAKKVKEISREDILSCYQCGMCSANCPMVSDMDLTPRHIVELARLGQNKEIGNSKTVWICASCFTCTVRCPRELDLSKIMEAIRLLTLRKNIDYIRPEEIPPEVRFELPQIALVSSLRKFTG